MPIISTFPNGSGSGGSGGLALAAVTGIETLTAAGKVYVKWTDPNDLVVAGSTLATWGGTKLIRKAGSPPVSRRDGVEVLDCKERNKYQNAYFCDSGLTDGETYYYKFFPYTTQNAYTDSPDDEFSAVPAAVPVGNVSGMSAVAAGNGKLAIKWTDPAATVVSDGVTLATWANTVVVVKAGSYATDPDDSNVAYRKAVTTRNQYASNPLTVTGLTNGTVYYVSFFPTSTDGAVNTATANRTTGTPDRLVITAVPSQNGTLTYNGGSQSPNWNGYDASKMTIGNQTAGTNAGTYTAQFTPKDDYKWSDNSITAKNVPWTIGKKAGTLNLSASSVMLDKTARSKTVTISGEFDGSYSVQSSNPSVATVSISGNVITINSVNDKTGTANITVSCSGGSNYTAPGSKPISVTAKFVTVYGVQWDGTSTTALSRTDAAAEFTNPVPAVNNGNGSSPFDSLLPWSGMVKSEDAEAGTLVAIPKFWYKWTKSGNTLKLQIADGATDGFFVSPAHADRGDGKGERDVVYVGRYHCHTSNYKSQTGGKPKASITRSAARTGIHNLGATIWQLDYAMRLTIQMLYLVEFADWNSQTKIGYGCGNNSGTENMGATDGMTYHTGTKQSSRTTYGVGVQYRWIEGLWDNVLDWMDGCYYNSSGMNIIKNPASFSDTSGGSLIGKPPGGWISAFEVVEKDGIQWIYPSGRAGSDSTYIPDSWDFYASGPCLRCGGNYSQYLAYGLFCVSYSSATNANGDIGCRLQKLP